MRSKIAVWQEAYKSATQNQFLRNQELAINNAAPIRPTIYAFRNVFFLFCIP